jgi:hypothetical protein
MQQVHRWFLSLRRPYAYGNRAPGARHRQAQAQEPHRSAANVAAEGSAAVELSVAGAWPKASVAQPLRDELLQLCRQRLDAFRQQRGEEVGCLLTQKLAALGTGAATARRSPAPAGTD